MSIIFFEGFDLYGNYPDTEQDMFVRRDVWNGSDAFVDNAEYVPRNNGNYLNLTSNTGPPTNYRDMYRTTTYGIDGKSHLIGGMAFNIPEVGDPAYGYPRLCSIRFQPNGVNDQQWFILNLEPAVTDVTLHAICNIEPETTDISIPGVAIGIWHYVEWDIKIDNPGHMKVWLNGSLRVDVPVTPNGRTFWYLLLHPVKTGDHPSGLWLDDMVLLDPTDASQGAKFQDRLGPIQIRPVPLVGDASPSSWTASSGGDKYLDVDEQPGPNDKDSTYISTGSAPQTQMFNATPHDDSLPLIAVTSFMAVKQPNPTVVTANMSFMADTEETPVGLPLQNVYRLFSTNYVTLPGGAPITTLGIAATDWGVRSQV